MHIFGLSSSSWWINSHSCRATPSSWVITGCAMVQFFYRFSLTLSLITKLRLKAVCSCNFYQPLGDILLKDTICHYCIMIKCLLVILTNHQQLWFASYINLCFFFMLSPRPRLPLPHIFLKTLNFSIMKINRVLFVSVFLFPGHDLCCIFWELISNSIWFPELIIKDNYLRVRK